MATGAEKATAMVKIEEAEEHFLSTEPKEREHELASGKIDMMPATMDWRDASFARLRCLPPTHQ